MSDAAPQPPSVSDRLAHERTELAGDRTVMAADRTLMAWIRTALAMISFGFTIYKFLHVFAGVGDLPPPPPQRPARSRSLPDGAGNGVAGGRPRSIRADAPADPHLRSANQRLVLRGVRRRDSGSHDLPGDRRQHRAVLSDVPRQEPPRRLRLRRLRVRRGDDGDDAAHAALPALQPRVRPRARSHAGHLRDLRARRRGDAALLRISVGRDRAAAGDAGRPLPLGGQRRDVPPRPRPDRAAGGARAVRVVGGDRLRHGDRLARRSGRSRAASSTRRCSPSRRTSEGSPSVPWSPGSSRAWPPRRFASPSSSIWRCSRPPCSACCWRPSPSS